METFKKLKKYDDLLINSLIKFYLNIGSDTIIFHCEDFLFF